MLLEISVKLKCSFFQSQPALIIMLKLERKREEALNDGYAAANILSAELEFLDLPTKEIPHNLQTIESI